MVKFQTIKQKARIILNSDDAKKTLRNEFLPPVVEAPIIFDGAVGVVVDILTGEIHINGHSFTPVEPVVYANTGGTAIGGLPAGNYNVIYVNPDVIKLATTLENAAAETAIKLTSIGTGTHTLTMTKTFAPNQITGAHSITIIGHTFETGTRVQYTTSGAAIDKLTNNDYYYVVNNGVNTIKLCKDYEDSIARPAKVIEIVALVSADTHSLSKVVPFNTQGSIVVDTVREQINIPGHNYSTGDKVQYKVTNASTVIGGLQDNVYYFVIKIDDDSFQLAQERDDALLRKNLNITGVGTGGDHSFTRIIDRPIPVCTNHRFKLDNLPENLNDKCRLSVESFQYVKNYNTFDCKSIGGVYIKSLTSTNTTSSQGYSKGVPMLPLYFGENVSYNNFDIEKTSIPLPHNISQILQNGIEIFVDSKKISAANQDISGFIDEDAFNLSLVIYELEDFEYVDQVLNDGVKHTILPKFSL